MGRAESLQEFLAAGGLILGLVVILSLVELLPKC